MDKHFIRLRESREFNDVLNIIVTFIRHNFMPLTRPILWIAIPFALIEAILMVFGTANLTTDPGSVFIVYGAIPFQYLANILMTAYAYCFIVLYQKHRGEPFTTTDVWRHFRSHFWRLLSGGFMFIVVFIVGLSMCFIPGIYVGVPLSFMSMVILAEHTSVFDSLPRCLELIKNNWWKSFFVLFIANFILSVLTSFVAVPAEVFKYVVLLNIVKIEITTFVNVLIYLAQFLGNLAGHYAMLLMGVAIGIQYYNLVEKLDYTGLLERIDAIYPTGTEE